MAGQAYVAAITVSGHPNRQYFASEDKIATPVNFSTVVAIFTNSFCPIGPYLYDGASPRLH